MKRAVYTYTILTLGLTFSLAVFFYIFELDTLSAFLMLVPLLVAFSVQKIILKRPIFGNQGLGFKLGKKRYLILAPLFSLAFIFVVFLISYMLNPDLFSTEHAHYAIQNTTTYDAELSLMSNIVIAGSIQLMIAPVFNILIFIGEEAGWRSFLYPYLILCFGKKGMILGGVIWGIWHTPMIYLYDLNFGPYHHMGLVFMIIFCILSGIIFQFIYYKSGSVYSVALMHGMLNIAGEFIFNFADKSEYNYFIDGATGVIGLTILSICAFMCYRKFPVDFIKEA